MSRRKDPRGRPSIGQPEMVWGRVSVECRSAIDDLADEYGLPKARIVAALLAVGLDNLDQIQLTTRKSDQEELPLKAS
jgi:hypothetical protein